MFAFVFIEKMSYICVHVHLFQKTMQNKRPMGHYAHKSSIVDYDNTNKDRQWTTDYPISSHSTFQLWWAKN